METDTDTNTDTDMNTNTNTNMDTDTHTRRILMGGADGKTKNERGRKTLFVDMVEWNQ